MTVTDCFLLFAAKNAYSEGPAEEVPLGHFHEHDVIIALFIVHKVEKVSSQKQQGEKTEYDVICTKANPADQCKRSKEPAEEHQGA